MAEGVQEGKGEGGSFGVVDVGGIEGEDDPVAAEPGKRADRLAVKANVEDFEVSQRR